MIGPRPPLSSTDVVLAPSDKRCALPSEDHSGLEHLGVVVIGRNEGERLRRCLAALVGRTSALVYVDSGSSDGSVELATGMGAQIVELDISIPFTAARARNAGLAKLREIYPSFQLVQFVDGDCELVSEWLAKASTQILADPTLAAVSGRLRERHPEASIYNRLCDIEWNTPVGNAETSGGIVLMRIQAFSEVGGFNPDLIAGEEPDLCLRLRQRGYRILRIDAEMGWHDANIKRFGQWLKRCVRSGHAYAEVFARHRHEPERYFAKQVRRGLFWGALVPALTLCLLWPSGGWSSILVFSYLVLAVRIFRFSRRCGFSSADACLYTLSCVLDRVPSAYGQLSYWARRALGKRSALIEYKNAGS
jgi:GT2 family glycosyltransferase